MVKDKINGEKLALMFKEGALTLEKNRKKVDALNVFPVPDGDTGTNMSLTIQTGVKEITSKPNHHAGKLAKTFSKGLLMGARGNSGVILSQLFRGFSQAVEQKAELGIEELAKALEEGVKTAYKAVMKPVEGTILTVAKDTAENVEKQANNGSLVKWMEEVVHHATASLQTTPDLLPVLKEAEVVDSGGQGLVYIYEGMLRGLKGEKTEKVESESPSLEELVKIEHYQHAQTHVAPEDIEFGYCTEVMIQLEKELNEETFRTELSSFGDSILVVRDDDLVKIHIHAEYPGEVLTKSQSYGSLVHVKIDNMRKQREEIISYEHEQSPKNHSEQRAQVRYGVVTVAFGEGIVELFKGMGAHQVILGGQTMNPSTEDISNAIAQIDADHIFVLPNNSNIIMAAEQAANVVDKDVEVIPTKSIAEGLSALFVIDQEKDATFNRQAMLEAMKDVKSGQVTYAVRDSRVNGNEIKEGDFIGLLNKEIKAAGTKLEEVTKQLLRQMIDDDSEIVTMIYGEGVDEIFIKELEQFFSDTYPEVEVEWYDGKQPIYSLIIAVE